MDYADKIHIICGMPTPTLRQLQYLIAIAEEGSFSRAAETCNVTQSTLSAAIQELEDILGRKLISRGARQAVLLPLGEDIVSQARKIEEHIDTIFAYARQRDEPLSGPFRLGVIPTIAPYMLPEILPELQRAYPSLDLHIHEDLTHRLLEKIAQNQLDAVLMALPFKTPGLEVRVILEESFLLATPTGRSIPPLMDIADLQPEELLLLEDGHCLRDQALSACNIKPYGKRKAFRASSLGTLIQMVAHGYGVTLLPEMTARSLPTSIRLTPFKTPTPKREIGLAWKKGAAAQKDILAFYSAITSALNQNQAVT